MKKIFALILSVLLCFSASFAVGCNEEESADYGTVSLKYFQDGSELIPMLKSGQLDIGLLPEPAATKLTVVASDKVWYRTDLQALYDGQRGAYPQAVMLVKESLLNTYPELITAMQNIFENSVEWVKNNTADAVNAVNGVLDDGATESLVAANINEEVVENCKIYWQSALDAKTDVTAYVNDVRGIVAESANVVSDDFYYDGNANGEYGKNSVTVIAPDGAPALAIAKFIYDNEDFDTELNFNYKVVSPTTIGGAVSQGTGDIVIIPVTAATKLYKAQTSNPYKMVSVVTHGNLYIMSTAPFVTLAGKKVGVIGQGNVPDLTFKAVLKKSGLGWKLAD